MNKFDFNNITAVITGGGQGFGLDIAKRFLKSGANVIIWDIDEDLLKSAVAEVNNSKLQYNVIDVSNYSQIEKTVLAHEKTITQLEDKAPKKVIVVPGKIVNIVG